MERIHWLLQVGIHVHALCHAHAHVATVTLVSSYVLTIVCGPSLLQKQLTDNNLYDVNVS